MRTRVVVVGGGVVGLATAYCLQRDGAEVTVLERNTLGSGASWGNSGWITPTFAAPLPSPDNMRAAFRGMARRDGSFYISLRHLPRLAPWLLAFARASSRSTHAAGLRATANLAGSAQRLYDQLMADGVHFEVKKVGVLHAFRSPRAAEHSLRALAPFADLGYDIPSDVVDGHQLRLMEPALGPGVEAGFIVQHERAIYPSSLIRGLRDRLIETGGTVREHEPVEGYITRRDVVEGVCASGGVVDADAVVLAAGVWSRPLAHQLGVRVPLEAGKGFSFSITPLTMPKHCLHLFEAKIAMSPFDAGLRLAGTMELSGTQLRVDRRRIRAVIEAAKPYLASWPEGPVREEWVGMRPMTPDGLPAIGRSGKWRNFYVATGHGMLGVLLAPPTGEALSALILRKREAPELRPFSPDRFRRSKWA